MPHSAASNLSHHSIPSPSNTIILIPLPSLPVLQILLRCLTALEIWVFSIKLDLVVVLKVSLTIGRAYRSVMIILLNLLLLIDFVYMLSPSAISIFPVPLTLSLMHEIKIWLRWSRSTDPLSIERRNHLLVLVLLADLFRHSYCF